MHTETRGIAQRLFSGLRREPLRLSLPLFVEVDLDLDARSRRSRLDADAWQRVARSLTSVSYVRIAAQRLEGHPTAAALVHALDSSEGPTYSIETMPNWEHSRLLAKELQALRRLHVLRLVIDGDEIGGERVAVSIRAGLRTWLVVDPRGLAMQEAARAAAEAGAKLLVVRSSTRTEYDDKWREEVERLRRRGFAIAFEGCRTRCAIRPATVRIDAAGDMSTCAHEQPFGSVVDDGLAAAWSRHPVSALVATPAPPAMAISGLAESLCPVACFRIRDERFGAIVHRGTDFVPLRGAGVSLARAIDGTTSLDALHRRFGAGAVELIHALFARGLVTFRRAP